MTKFMYLSDSQTKELDELLNIADDVLGTTIPIIKNDKKATSIVGTAIGGAAVAAGTGALGVAGSTAGIGSAASFVGGGIAGATGIAAPPVAVVAIGAAAVGAGIGYVIASNKKKKEVQKQKNYCIEITMKLQAMYKQKEALIKEHANTDKRKDDTIKSQKEKIAEYEVIIAALQKKLKELQMNCRFA